MALRDYHRKRYFQGWCTGLYVAELERSGTIPLYQETFTIRITRFTASQCCPITHAEYDSFEHDLDGGHLEEGDFTWYGTCYRHQAHGLKIRSVAGPQGVTREGLRTYGEFAGLFVGYVTEVVQLEVPDEPPGSTGAAQAPEPPPETPIPEDSAKRERRNAEGLSAGHGLSDFVFRLVGGAFALWSLMAVLGALPSLLIGLAVVLVAVGLSKLLGRIFGGLMRYSLQFGFALLSYALLAIAVIGLISFLFGRADRWSGSRAEEHTQSTTKRKVEDGSTTSTDTSIVHHLKWTDNGRSVHEMEWEVLRSECLSSLVHLKLMAQNRTATTDWTTFYDELRSHDSVPLARLTAAFEDLQRKEQLPRELLPDVVVTCVQSIPYSLILDSHCPSPGAAGRGLQPCKGLMPFGVNPPSAFMGDLAGDCDTRSLLLVAVLQGLGFDATMLLSDHYHHAMLGLSMPSRGASLELNGKAYYFWETTNTGFRLGEIHPDCSDLTQWSIIDL